MRGAPRPARPEGDGTLPLQQARYCEPSRHANARGYWIFLPMSFTVRWHGGHEYDISFDDAVTWYDLDQVAYSDSFQAWDAAAPDNCKGYCPPFVSATAIQGMIQIWTGWFARTREGYSLAVRPPPNIPPSPHYTILSGDIETDTWFGPLIDNVRINTSVRNIKFDAALSPFIQVEPYRRLDVKDLYNFVVDENGLTPELYQAYYKTLAERHRHIGEPGFDRFGHYARSVRRQSKRQ